MPHISRRLFTQHMLGSLLTYSLVKTLADNHLLARSIKPIARKWVIEMEQLSHDLMVGKSKPVEWQERIESLLAQVDLKDLLQAIDYEHLAQLALLPDDHESAEKIKLPRATDLPDPLSFSPNFYALKKDRAIVPHGHHNMATMHMILRGQTRARHFDRIYDEPKHMIIRLTRDKVCGPGEVTTISDEKDNIHWFVGLTEPVYMFNIGVYGINPNMELRGRDYVDVERGEKLGDGSLRVGKINGEEAYRRYGKI